MPTLAKISDDISGVKSDVAELRGQLGTLFQGQVTMRNELRAYGDHISIMAIAVDGHTARLDRLDGRLDRIGRQLGLDAHKH